MRSLARILSLTAIAAGLMCAQGLKVTSVRFWSLGDATRVAIETSGPFEYSWARLEKPDRLFFDIAGAKSELTPKGVYVVKVGDKLLQQIRVAQPTTGRTRVVLDLEDDHEFTASQLANPNRLIIELRRKGANPEVAPSMSGGKKLTTPSRQQVDADLAATEAVAVTDAKPEPRKFTLPADFNTRAAAAAPVVKEPELTPPPKALPQVAKNVKTPAPALGLPTTDAEFPSAVKPSAAKEVPAGPVPRAARSNEDGSKSMTRVLGLKLGRVVIDAGHGGHDHGTTGPSGFTEKELVLDVAMRLGEILTDRMGAEVFYTRDDDTFIPLEGRTKFANDKRADLFISIHANSSPVRKAAGVETYYLNFTTQRDALDIAARENAGSGRTVFDLRELVQKIALKDKAEESREFAARVQNSLYAFAAKNNTAVRNRGVKRAPFVVLIGASMPSILTEIGFLSNPEEEKLLKKPEHRQKLAEALYKGINAYAGTLSRFDVARRNGE
jgi:N-acetylmuramoyl-L-alanine amidase